MPSRKSSGAFSTLLLPLLFCLLTLPAAGQIGFRISQARPLGEFGATFKKAPAYDLYYLQTSKNRRFQGRAGLYYTELRPRLDTFPTFAIKDDFVDVVLPGYVVYHKFNIKTIYIDLALRLFSVRRFSMYAGIGLTGGLMHIEYTREIETLIRETHASIDENIVGFRPKLSVEYRINDHFGAYLEVMNQALIREDWSTTYPHNNFGIGLNYLINP